jgi:hypothetical protein
MRYAMKKAEMQRKLSARGRCRRAELMILCARIGYNP